jgi:Tfp pilus assembly protein PilN
MKPKQYIIINLNQKESRQTRMERWRERGRWAIFTTILLLLIGTNGLVYYIGQNYSQLIAQKEAEIQNVKKEILQLREKGKNLSKADIIDLAKLESDRILWARTLQLLGQLTPEDIALTGLKYKNQRLMIEGIAVNYADQKEFEIVHNYLNALKKNRDFSKHFSRIKFSQGSIKTIRGQDIIQFVIEATVRLVPPSQQTRAPRKGITS